MKIISVRKVRWCFIDFWICVIFPDWFSKSPAFRLSLFRQSLRRSLFLGACPEHLLQTQYLFYFPFYFYFFYTLYVLVKTKRRSPISAGSVRKGPARMCGPIGNDDTSECQNPKQTLVPHWGCRFKVPVGT